MAFEKVEESDVQEGQKTFFKKDPDNGRPVFVGIRPVPSWKQRALRHEIAKGLTTGKAAKEEINRIVDRNEEFTRRKALFAMTFTENFSIRAAGPQSAEAIGVALGAPVEPKTDVVLDGRWNDALKLLVLTTWPELAAWVVEKSDAMGRLEAEEEEELGKT
jgi:hypothetical protein